jgi:hypothetical protein
MPEGEDDILNKARFLWEEYSYRHDLCWKLIFQTTAVVILILVIPFTKIDIVKIVNYWIISLPSIATVFLVFMYCRMTKELSLLEKVRTKHREFQAYLYNIQHDFKKETFSLHVKLYLIALSILVL